MRVVQFSAPFEKFNDTTDIVKILKPRFGERLMQLGVECPHSAPYMVRDSLTFSNNAITINGDTYYISPKDILEFDDLLLEQAYNKDSAIIIKIPTNISKYCIVTAAYDTLEHIQKEE